MHIFPLRENKCNHKHILKHNKPLRWREKCVNRPAYLTCFTEKQQDGNEHALCVWTQGFVYNNHNGEVRL